MNMVTFSKPASSVWWWLRRLVMESDLMINDHLETWRHALLLTIMQSWVRLIPKMREIRTCENPALWSAIMRATSVSVYLAQGFDEPSRLLGLFIFQRPFACMSLILSCCVPRNRCAGLTHFRLSQACRTYMPGGIGPWIRNQAARCA